MVNQNLRTINVCHSETIGPGILIEKDDDVDGRWIVEFKSGTTEVWENNLISEEIWNSPLYQALKEN